jgi:hypothetical protein
MEEFSCLSELGKYAKDKDSSFQEKVASFFWDVIVNSGTKNLELVDSCIQKHRDMVKFWPLEQKMDMFVRLVKCIASRETPSLPCFKLLQGLIKDQSERSTYTPSTTTSGYPSTSVGTYPPQTGSGYGGGTGGSALRTKVSDPSQTPPDSSASTNAETTGAVEKTVELTLQSALQKLISEENLMQHLLDDLGHYCSQVAEHLKDQTGGKVDRRKLHVKGGPYSHHAEIDERLQFIKFIAQVSEDYCISKKELGVIYDLLVTKSCVDSDQQEFLTWCKSSCDQQSTKHAILDLGEVGEFFTEKIACHELDVRTLGLVGFEFLQFYFISLNEKEGNLDRQTTPQATQKVTQYPSYSNTTGRWTTSYRWNNTKQEDNSSGLGKTPSFTLQKPPSELKELEMIWTLVLGCEVPEVVPRVIDFLIKVHVSLNDDLKKNKLAILKGLIDRCMKIIEEGKDPKLAVRVVEILKTLVHETEVSGTRGVLAHGALQRGEPLEALVVRTRAGLKGGDALILVFSNTSLWDLRKEVGKILALAPKYVQLTLGSSSSGKILRDADNGKTMKALGLTGGETIQASKLQVDEYIPNAPLIGADGDLTGPAKRIFSEWYDMFLDSEGNFTRESAAHFIQAACGDLPNQNDSRINGLFQAYDGNSDGKLEREEWLTFYRNSSRGEKASTVRENLSAFNVRPDLKKMSEVEDEATASPEELPRYFIPRDQKHFDLLMDLLDGKDRDVAEAAWELVQMLATNVTLYKRVLKLDIAKVGGSAEVDWQTFFDRAHAYKLLYTLQIVQAVLEEGEDETQGVVLLNSDSFPAYKVHKSSEKQEEVDQQNLEEQ